MRPDSAGGGMGLPFASQTPSRIFHEVTLVTYTARNRSSASRAAAIFVRALTSQCAVSGFAAAGGS